MEWFRLFSAQCSFHQCLQAKYLKFISLGPNNVFNIYSWHGLKLLTRLCLGLSHLRGHKFKHISVIVLMKFVFVENISNLRTISSYNVPYFLKKGQSSGIKFVILTTQLFTKMKTLSVIHFVSVKRTWMTVKVPVFLMQQ